MGVDSSYWSGARFSRRRVVAGLGIAGLAATPLAGCSSSNNNKPATSAAASATGTRAPAGVATSAPAASVAVGTPSRQSTPAASAAAVTPKKGGEITFSTATSTQSLDPHIGLSTIVIYWPLFSNLLTRHDYKTIEPLTGELIAKWEQPDPTTQVLHAQQNAKFHFGTTQGRAWDANDIKFNIERAAGKYDPQRIALFQRASLMLGLDHVDVVDSGTARAIFKTPNATFLTGISDLRNWTTAHETVEKDPDFKDVKNFGGTGPFMIESWDDTSMVGHYVANPSYFKQGQPYLAGIRQANLADPSALEGAFLSGKISFLATQSDTLRSDVMKNRPGARIVSWEGDLWDYLRLNQTRSSFGDVRVRQAIWKAIDYAGLNDSVYGKGYWDYTGPVVSSFPGAPAADQIAKQSPYNPATKQQDIADAKALMSAAGFPDGKITFKIMPAGATGATNDQSVAIQDQLKKIWPAMTISIDVPTDGGDFSRRLTNGDFDSVVYTSGAVPSLILEMGLHYRTGGSRNYTKFSNPDIDRLIDAGIAEFDIAKRNALLAQLNQVLSDNIWVLPIARAKGVEAVQPEVRGFDGTGIGGFTSNLDPPFLCDQEWIAS